MSETLTTPSLEILAEQAAEALRAYLDAATKAGKSQLEVVAEMSDMFRKVMTP